MSPLSCDVGRISVRIGYSGVAGPPQDKSLKAFTKTAKAISRRLRGGNGIKVDCSRIRLPGSRLGKRGSGEVRKCHRANSAHCAIGSSARESFRPGKRKRSFNGRSLRDSSSRCRPLAFNKSSNETRPRNIPVAESRTGNLVSPFSAILETTMRKDS